MAVSQSGLGVTKVPQSRTETTLKNKINSCQTARLSISIVIVPPSSGKLPHFWAASLKLQPARPDLEEEFCSRMVIAFMNNEVQYDEFSAYCDNIPFRAAVRIGNPFPPTTFMSFVQEGASPPLDSSHPSSLNFLVSLLTPSCAFQFC